MLTDTEIRRAKPKEKPYKLSDEKGLYLEIMPNGSRYWRMKYRFEGKEKRAAFGVYPEVTLKEAREKRDEARKLLAQSIDPTGHKRAVKAAKAALTEHSFEVIAREWFAKYQPTWSAVHADRIIRRLERDTFPWIGAKPIATLTAPDLLTVARRIEDRGALETAHRALQDCGQVFRYAIATGRAERNPVGDLRGALPPVKGEHFAALTEPRRLGELLRAIDAYEGTLVTKCALQLAPLVFVRPGELRQAQWADLDLNASEWRYLVTKTGTQHIVALSKQAVVILETLRPLTGDGRYVFPSARTPNGSRPMSDVALLAALRRMGFDKSEATVHGFRAVARTLLDEELGFPPHIIEHQLAHAVKDPLGRAYNRTSHLPERRKMMQAWADYLDRLKHGAEVIQLTPMRKA